MDVAKLDHTVIIVNLLQPSVVSLSSSTVVVSQHALSDYESGTSRTTIGRPSMWRLLKQCVGIHTASVQIAGENPLFKVNPVYLSSCILPICQLPIKNLDRLIDGKQNINGLNEFCFSVTLTTYPVYSGLENGFEKNLKSPKFRFFLFFGQISYFNRDSCVVLYFTKML